MTSLLGVNIIFRVGEKLLEQKVVDAAIGNPGVKGKYKMAAGVFYKNRLVAVGLNQYKTHPIMLQGNYREGQVYLHAEADAIVKASKLVDLSQCHMHVVRVTKGGRLALAKPCLGCFHLLNIFGLKEVTWTT